MYFKTIIKAFSIAAIVLHGSMAYGQVTDSLQVDTIAQKQEVDNGYGIFSMFDGNPGKAALFSLVLPGAGQAFNKRWWKVPLALAIEGTAIYVLSERISKYKRWDTEYRNVVMGLPPEIDPRIGKDVIARRRNDARQRKDYAWVVVIGIHIIAAADAFVDRHLIEFDVEDDLHVSINPISPLPGINLVVNF